MRKLAIFAMFMFVAANAIDSGAAGWVDPFAGGGSKGFADPFASTPKQSEGQEAKSDAKKKRQEQRAGEKDAKKKDQPSRQSGTSPSKPLQGRMPYPPNAPKELAKDPDKLMDYYDRRIDAIDRRQKAEAERERRNQIDPPFDPSARDLPFDESAIGKSTPKELVEQMKELRKIYEQVYSQHSDKRLTPYGVLLGQPYLTARASLETILRIGTKCKDGDVFYRDPANACFAILLHGEPHLAGSREEKVTGASMWLSKQCLKDDPGYDAIYKFMAKLGTQEYQDGWTTGSGVEGCIAAVKKIPDNMLPKLFGEVDMGVSYDILIRALEAIGAKKVRNYSNGGEFALDGSRLLIEYCQQGRQKHITYLAMDIGQESERIARFMNTMGLSKSLIQSKNATLRSQRGKNGRISKFEYTVHGNEYKCKAGVS